MIEGVDPEDPRPEGRYTIEANLTWYCVDDDLADTIATGPTHDGEPGDDWILSFTTAETTDDDRERVCVRLTPRALHELYVETTDRSADSGMAGHSAECVLCGDQVDLDWVIPNCQGVPTHHHC